MISRRSFFKTIGFLTFGMLGTKVLQAKNEESSHPDAKFYQWSYGGPDGLGMSIRSTVKYGHPAFAALTGDLKQATGKTFNYSYQPETYDDIRLIFRTIRNLPKLNWVRQKYQIQIMPNNKLPSEDCLVWWGEEYH